MHFLDKSLSAGFNFAPVTDSQSRINYQQKEQKDKTSKIVHEIRAATQFSLKNLEN